MDTEYKQALASIHGESVVNVPDWQTCLIDLAIPLPEPEPVLIQSDTEIPMLHRRNISTVAAAAKVGKTFLVSAIAAAALNDEGFLGFHAPKKMNVLFIDTEMDGSDTQVVAKRVHLLVGYPININNERFTVLNLREQDAIARLAIVESAIDELRPDLVLLDGVVDVCQGSFNEIEPSQKIVTKLAQISTLYNCHVMTCLHVNKNTQELRGHLGAFLRQKSELTLLLSRVVDTISYIEVKPIDSRHRPINDFAFRINNEGLPEMYEPQPKTIRSAKLDGLFSEILPLPTSLNFAELQKKVSERAKVQERMARRKISTALENGVILKNEAGYYHLPIKQVENENLPF